MSIIYKGNGQVLNLIFANVTGSLRVTGHGIRVPHFADDIMAQCECGQHHATNEVKRV
jgi:hypothetical protein